MTTPDDDLLAEQHRIFDLLSQETRHRILQFILGHPHHLMSIAELDHAISKSKAAIKDQLGRLEEEGIIKTYHYEPSESKRDLPATFYGPTERGVTILYQSKYLHGLPIARSLYDHTKKPKHIQRHEDAPRPDLPEKVREALTTDDSKEDDGKFVPPLKLNPRELDVLADMVERDGDSLEDTEAATSLAEKVRKLESKYERIREIREGR